MSRKFVVTAERGNGVWVLESDNGAVSQVRRLDQATEEMREAVAFLANLPVDEVEVEVRPVLPSSYNAATVRAEQFRQEEARARKEAAVAAREAACALVETGMSMRDAATIMGVSHQRVAQLVRSSA